MKMLMLSSRLPYPLTWADQKTVYHLMEFFSQRHTVHLAALVTDPKELEHLPKLEPFAERIETVHLPPSKSRMMTATAPFRGMPLQTAYFNSPEMHRVVQNMVREEEYDLVYAHLIRSSEWIRRVPCRRKVMALQISQTLNYGRLAAHAKAPHKKAFYGLESRLCRKYETTTIHDFDLNLIISPFDRRAIDPQEKFDRFFFSPHGMDTNAFRPMPEIETMPQRIMLTGNMTCNTNVDAAKFFTRDMFPAIRQKFPNAEFHIVGRGPHPDVAALASIDGVKVTGTVPHLAEYLATADVVVDPVRIGAGMQNKLIEGMAMAKPNVATDVANEGIAGEHGKELLVAPADQPQAFADAVIRLLEDKELAERLGTAARAFVEKGWTWEKHFVDLENRFVELADEKTETRKAG